MRNQQETVTYIKGKLPKPKDYPEYQLFPLISAIIESYVHSMCLESAQSVIDSLATPKNSSQSPFYWDKTLRALRAILAEK